MSLCPSQLNESRHLAQLLPQLRTAGGTDCNVPSDVKKPKLWQRFCVEERSQSSSCVIIHLCLDQRKASKLRQGRQHFGQLLHLRQPQLASRDLQLFQSLRQRRDDCPQRKLVATQTNATQVQFSKCRTHLGHAREVWRPGPSCKLDGREAVLGKTERLKLRHCWQLCKQAPHAAAIEPVLRKVQKFQLGSKRAQQRQQRLYPL
mmetsp:Transcript_7369/g.15299  ORF Transcript_7369/g.15299 Transcript_7369/m.15299 type:complete len:204 (+) Transcript_7369:18-629(+)